MATATQQRRARAQERAIVAVPTRDKVLLRAFLERDRLRAGYAVADLEEREFAKSRWGIASEAGEPIALVLEFGGLTPQPLFVMGDPDGIVAILRDVIKPRLAYLAADEAHLAPMRRPDIDAAVRPLCRRMVLTEALRIMGGVYRRRRLTVPTLVVFGRQDHPTTEELMARLCRPERYADRVEFAYVDDAAHFITDDAPAAVAALALDWFERAA